MKDIRMLRPQELARNIVVIDGMSCAGKPFASPLLSSLDRGELWTINHLYEYICTMYHYRRMLFDAALTLFCNYDEEFSKRYYDGFLKGILTTAEEFRSHCDLFRPEHLWQKSNGEREDKKGYTIR